MLPTMLPTMLPHAAAAAPPAPEDATLPTIEELPTTAPADPLLLLLLLLLLLECHQRSQQVSGGC